MILKLDMLKEQARFGKLTNREIAILSASIVMGWGKARVDSCENWWNPAGDIAHAWQVRERMEELGWTSEDRLTWMGWGDKSTHPWGYSFWFQDYHLGNTIGGHYHVKDKAQAARAITLAAILTMEIAGVQREDIESIAKSGGVDISKMKGASMAKYSGAA